MPKPLASLSPSLAATAARTAPSGSRPSKNGADSLGLNRSSRRGSEAESLAGGSLRSPWIASSEYAKR